MRCADATSEEEEETMSWFWTRSHEFDAPAEQVAEAQRLAKRPTESLETAPTERESSVAGFPGDDISVRDVHDQGVQEFSIELGGPEAQAIGHDAAMEGMACGSSADLSRPRSVPGPPSAPTAWIHPSTEPSTAGRNAECAPMTSSGTPRDADAANSLGGFGAIEPFFNLLPVTTRYVLTELFDKTGSTATELAHKRNVTVSAIRPQLARLEKVGLVQHYADDTSRSGPPLNRYELTGIGRTLLSASTLVWATADGLSERVQELSSAASKMKTHAALINEALAHFKLESTDG
jgi:DNA-binding MarR family transcriptional regulator